MFKTFELFVPHGLFKLVFYFLEFNCVYLYFSFSIEKSNLEKKMDHFLFTQLCRNCKKGCKTFKVSLSDYDVARRFKLSKVEAAKEYSFVCSFCKDLTILDFEQVCNPNTVWYMRRENELNKQFEQVINELLQIKIEKLKIADM